MFFNIPIRRAGLADRDVTRVLARRGPVPVPLACGSVRVLARLKLAPLGLVRNHAGPFHDGQNLIGRMYVRPRARAVVEKDGYDLKLLALFASDQVVHVYRAFEVFGVGRASF